MSMKKLLMFAAFAVVLCSCGSGNSKKNDTLANVHEGHEWVDLGLPSGLKWATCNVGASSPGDYGNYYAWGEIVSIDEGNVSDGRLYGKSTVDISGNSTYDAARVNWGGDWRMPTDEEFQELIDNCNWTWTTQNGHNGCKVTSKKNGQSIFLPAAGWRYGAGGYGVGSLGVYWSSTPYESHTYGAYELSFSEDYHYVDWYGRFYGRSVRPVLE